MQNALAAFIFIILNVFFQTILYFIPVVNRFMFFVTPLHVLKVLIANSSIAILLYDVFFDIGMAKAIINLILVTSIILTGDSLCKNPIMMIFIMSAAFAISYFVCFFNKGLGTKPCLICAREQLHDGVDKPRLDLAPPYSG
jgi:hypothetical protein